MLVALAATSCTGTPESATRATLTARPATATTTPWSRAEAAAALGPAMAVSLPTETGGRPVPLLVLLHGAGGRGQFLLDRVVAATGRSPAVIIAPNSGGRTWDFLDRGPGTMFELLEGRASEGSFGPDVAAIDKALTTVMGHVAIDATRITIAGFSDGATYALALGLANGELFSRVLAFSPGFVPAIDAAGQPAVFVVHGRADRVFPIDRTGRRVATTLQHRGYEVRVREFDGGHELTDSTVREGVAWAIADREPRRLP